MQIQDFLAKKIDNIPISMVTCYDSWSAALIAQTGIDCILVGDSLSMVMQGHDSTLYATPEHIAYHIAAVRRGAPNAFIIGDLPFLSYRKTLERTMEAVDLCIKAGANAVKLEGCRGNEHTISHIVDSGVPVMGHLGLTPQSVHALGGYKVQGKTEEAGEQIFQEALRLEKAGCFSLVLECVPAELAGEITRELHIPVIGIGAGPATDGQVLVLQDLLGVTPGKKPKFVRQFLSGADLIIEALSAYHNEVTAKTFPSKKESY